MKPLPPMPDHVRVVFEAAAGGPRFFPQGVFPAATSHEFKADYAAGALALMEEKPLLEHVGGDTVAGYRLLWLPTFAPAVVVRVLELTDASGKVCAKISSEDAGFGVGRVAHRKEHTVKRRRMDRLRSLTSQGSLWEMLPTSEDHGLDGEDLFFEAAAPGRYHVVCRWSPDSGLIRTLGEEMMRLSGFCSWLSGCRIRP